METIAQRIFCILLLIQFALGNDHYDDHYEEKKVVIRPIFPAGQAVPSAPLSPAVLVDDRIFWSSAIFGTVAHGGLVEGFEQQAQLSLSNVQYILEAAYLKLINVVKVEVTLTDIDNFEEFIKIYSELPLIICSSVDTWKWKLGKAPFPALVITEANLPGGALVQIVITAIKGRVVSVEPPPSAEEYGYKS